MLKVSFLQGHGFFIVISEGFCWSWKSRAINMFVKKLNPMEQVGPLFVNHFHRRISSPINNAIILICLHTICHEPFENKQTFPFNNCIQFFPHNTLNFSVLELHITNRNHHDLVIDRVINMISHGRPSLNTLYVIKHHPRILKILIDCIHYMKSNPDVAPLMDILSK
jgi:hypothetical protein